MSETRNRIAELLRLGLNTVEIAGELGVVTNTVDYHVQRLAEMKAAETEATRRSAPISAARLPTTRERVHRLLADGLSRAEVARRLGISKGTVTYHARGLDQPIDERCARRYDWSVVQVYYDEGHSLRECRTQFGFSYASWHDAVKRGDIVPRPVAMPIETLLQKGVRRNRNHVKLRLLSAGLIANRCSECGISEWHGRPLSLALHHVNGDGLDNRLENLQLLCPNCHSQTHNFSGRNGRRAGRAARTA